MWDAAELAASAWSAMSTDDKEQLALRVAEEVQARVLANPLFAAKVGLEDGPSILEFARSATYNLFGGVEQAYASGDPAQIAEMWGRVSGNVAMEVATCGVPGDEFLKFAKTGDLAHLASNAEKAALATEQSTLLRTMETGAMDAATARKAFGVGDESLTAAQRIFKALGVKGYARERGEEAIRLIDELGVAVWKPEAMKPKNLSEIDEYLGVPTGNRGKVAIFWPDTDSVLRARLQGQDPEVIEAVLERAASRRDEYVEYSKKFKGWKDGDGIPVDLNLKDNGILEYTGKKENRAFDVEIVEGSGSAPELVFPKMADEHGVLKYISGDIDWVHFSFLDGTPLDEVTASVLYKLMNQYAGLQHPETITWIRDGMTMFKGKANQLLDYAVGPAKKALLEVSGDSTRAVRINEKLTRFDVNGRGHQIFFDGGLKSTARATKVQALEALGSLYHRVRNPAPAMAPLMWLNDFFGDQNTDNSIGGCKFSFKATNSATLLRRTINGAIETYKGGSWSPWKAPTTCNVDPVVLAPATSSSEDVQAGATRIPIEDILADFPELAPYVEEWFQVGDTIVIGPGTPEEETATITGFGSILVAEGLRFDHPAGTLIAVQDSPASAGAGDGGTTSVAVPDISLSSICDPGATAPFGDVDGVHADAVACMARWGLMLGLRSGLFGPDRQLTRGQLATILVRLFRLAGVEAPAAPGNTFTDDDGSVHAPAIDALAALGIFRGEAAGDAQPQLSVTREQFASLVARLLDAIGVDLPTAGDRFDDVVGPHADAVERLATAGVLMGVGPRHFAPHRPIGRAQAASILSRALALLVQAGQVEGSPSPG